VDAAHENRKQLGQLMVDEGFITLDQLQHALSEQSSTGRPLGKVLVDLGFVSEGAVANALAEQHGGLLKTEFGISAGLHAVQGGAARPAAPAPAAVSPAAARVAELEAQLQGVLRERNALSQSLNELKLRQAEAAPDPAASARVAELEAELEHVHADRSALMQKLNELQARQAEAEAEPQPDPAAAARVVELEAHLHEVLAERNDFAERLNELQARLSALAQAHEAEIAHVTDSMSARIDELDAEAKAAAAVASARIAELEAELGAERERSEQLQDVPEPEETQGVRAHLLFVPSASGYALIDFDGPDPPSGALLDVDGISYVVRRVGASPFPGDGLRCVYLEPV
jgi:hypothetical protein